MRRAAIITSLIVLCHATFSQVPLSFSTDMDLQRNFKKQQQYWAVGSHIQFCFHLTPKDGIYSWFGFYTNGNFSNRLTATAKLPTTVPQQINYRDSSQMRFRHFSIGWKKFIKGLPNAEKGWNLYSSAGFGLLLGKAFNYSSTRPDSALYDLPILPGEGNFRRLTLDLGLGVEFPLGADIYLYSEARTFIPTSDYPSKYIFINEKAPMVGSLGAGIRILF